MHRNSRPIDPVATGRPLTGRRWWTTSSSRPPDRSSRGRGLHTMYPSSWAPTETKGRCLSTCGTTPLRRSIWRVHKRHSERRSGRRWCSSTPSPSMPPRTAPRLRGGPCHMHGVMRSWPALRAEACSGSHRAPDVSRLSFSIFSTMSCRCSKFSTPSRKGRMESVTPPSLASCSVWMNSWSQSRSDTWQTRWLDCGKRLRAMGPQRARSIPGPRMQPPQRRAPTTHSRGTSRMMAWVTSRCRSSTIGSETTAISGTTSTFPSRRSGGNANVQGMRLVHLCYAFCIQPLLRGIVCAELLVLGSLSISFGIFHLHCTHELRTEEHRVLRLE
eukprot:m.200072 g.200072  ORF g.200072 m.200072 type:complete len:329 (+) comp18779_c0_seq1:975-1961(+)